MIERNRIYRRTEAGRVAWETQSATVPVEYRRILGLLKGDTHYDSLRAGLVRYAEAEVAELLGELEERGLVQSTPGEAVHDLDFTDSLSLTELRAEHKKQSS